MVIIADAEFSWAITKALSIVACAFGSVLYLAWRGTKDTFR